ncbi:MAG: serine/threonine-protein kinase, partial [Planctomycetota bacterium]
MIASADLQKEVVSTPEKITKKGDPSPKKETPKPSGASAKKKMDLSQTLEKKVPQISAKAVTEKLIPAFKKRMLGGYELLEVLGQGAMGTVYKARQLSMDRLVAVKILSLELAENEDFRQRFLKEARATAKLNHNNIVSGIDVGEIQGEYFFVMEYVDGFSIQKRLERGGAEDEKQASNIVLQIAKALEHAHKHGLVHRDVKPDNILLTRTAVAKLCDLGLALETGKNQQDRGKSMGTPSYISPEQALGEGEVDIRSDIYSLGVTFFHMLSGNPPFQGSPAVVMTKHINEDLPDLFEIAPHLKEGTVQIVEKMLEKRPEDRYQTPTELIEDLDRVIAGYPPKYALIEEDESDDEEEKTPRIKEVSSGGAGKSKAPLSGIGKNLKRSHKANLRRALRRRRR